MLYCLSCRKSHISHPPDSSQMTFYRHLYLIFPVFINFLIGQPVLANGQFTISPQLLHFDYQEYEPDGTKVLRESGLMFGATFAYDDSLNSSVAYRLDFGISVGEVEYDGQTLGDGEPLESDTDQTFFDFGGQLGSDLGGGDFQAHVYGRADYKVWDRSINSTPRALGLHEIYRWWQIGVGAKSPIISNKSGTINVDVQLFKTLNPVMEVDLWFWDAGNPKFDLQERNGWQIKLDWNSVSESNRNLAVALLYRVWEFGRSDIRLINTNEGVKPLFEPDSDSEIIMLQVILSM